MPPQQPERLAVARGVSLQKMRQTLSANATRVFAFDGIDAAFEIKPS